MDDSKFDVSKVDPKYVYYDRHRKRPALTPVSENFNEVYEIEGKLKRFFERVFAGHRQFPFLKNDPAKSKVKIVVELPDDPQIIAKIPHIVISNVSGQIDPNMGLWHNFGRDIYGDHGEILYQEQLYSFQYNVTIFCVTGNSSTCKDLGLAVQKALAVVGVYDISELQGMHLASPVSVGPPVLRQQHPQVNFECAITFAGTLTCTYRRLYADDCVHVSENRDTLEQMVFVVPGETNGLGPPPDDNLEKL